MSSTFAPPQVPPPPIAPAPTDSPGGPNPAPPAPSGRRRSAGHIVGIVVGCLLLFPSVGMLTSGGVTLIGQAVATDGDGYFRFTLDQVRSDGVAVATTDLWLDDVDIDASPWVFDWLDVDVRLRVEGAGAADDVFVGIARSADVARYLAESQYSDVVEIDGSRSRYRQVTGARTIDAPTDQTFWTVASSGTGEQEVQWDARGGRWSVVVMNTDGTANVAADVEVGARAGAVTPVGVTLVSIGGILLIGAMVLIVVGARGRRLDPPSQGSARSAAG